MVRQEAAGVLLIVVCYRVVLAARSRVDMLKRAGKAVYHGDGDDRVKIFAFPVASRRRFDMRAQRRDILVAAHFAPRRDQRVDDCERRAIGAVDQDRLGRSEEHTSELQSLMRISYAVFCLKKKKKLDTYLKTITQQTINKST